MRVVITETLEYENSDSEYERRTEGDIISIIEDLEIYEAEYNDKDTEIHEAGENSGDVHDEDTDIHEAGENGRDVEIWEEEDKEDI
ncbi:hypothetical protein AMTR_s00014p00211820 [Amborella trichopoda]|uniref:Uncharacterized protein n=1 Tax=Amborella trichopoda TaxID=13333 RepID=W1PN62_AMBTC|nr:hypothetical protein AMTR_s00014p00211820 [Amborella trichopoda]